MINQTNKKPANEPSAEDLTREKTLFALWLTSRKFAKRRFNFWVSAVVFLCLIGYCFLAYENQKSLIPEFRKLEATGLTFSTSILGFLVAGFTIFVTVIRVDIFVKMARHFKGDTGESVLKYNLSAFIVTFVHYICYIFFCITSEIFLSSGGPISLLLGKANDYTPLKPAVDFIRIFGPSILFTFFGTWTVYNILLLKSFVYNVYQVTTTVVRWEMIQQESKENTA